jgi:hypothetical protein
MLRLRVWSLKRYTAMAGSGEQTENWLQGDSFPLSEKKIFPLFSCHDGPLFFDGSPATQWPTSGPSGRQSVQVFFDERGEKGGTIEPIT